MANGWQTREELERVYAVASSEQWFNYLLDLSMDPKFLKYPLYHLTFNDKLDDKIVVIKDNYIKPKEPLQGYFDEPLPSGFCLAPSLKDCYTGVNPDLERKFVSEIKDTFIMYLYRVETFSDTPRILLPDTLTDKYLLHDAHLTHEHRLIKGKLKLRKDRIIYFSNPLLFKNESDFKKKWIRYYPFNKPEIYGSTPNGYPMYILKEEYP